MVILDTEGRLVGLHAVPLRLSSTGIAPGPDWKIFFAEAVLDESQWKPLDPQWGPFSYADTRAAWQGSFPNRPSTPIRIEAAAFQGKPVNFEIVGPWTPTAQMQPFSVAQNVGNAFGLLLVLVTLISIFFARRNLRLGRGDRRNAIRLALFAAGGMIFSSLSVLVIPWVAGAFWILYIAIEPYVRRRWPKILVSWTRLLSGDWRDPLIASDALIGCAVGVLIVCLHHIVLSLLPSWFNYNNPFRPPTFLFESVIGIRLFVSLLLDCIMNAIIVNLAVICLLFLLRVILRNQKAALAACVMVLILVNLPANLWSFAALLVVMPVWVFVLVRFGLVAATLDVFAGYLLVRFPTTLEASAWYSGYGYVALAILAAIVLYAFRTSLGGRPLLAPSHLDD